MLSGFQRFLQSPKVLFIRWRDLISFWFKQKKKGTCILANCVNTVCCPPQTDGRIATLSQKPR